jgi:hypothetical protein
MNAECGTLNLRVSRPSAAFFYGQDFLIFPISENARSRLEGKSPHFL